MKHITLSQKKVNSALNIFDKAVNKILKANAILEKGIERAKKDFNTTADEIITLQNKVDEIGVSIIDHENEIKNNQKLIEKFKAFVK